MAKKDVVLVKKEDGIAVVTINRPQVLNSLNEEIFRTLGRLFEEFSLDTGVRAVILTGAGEKSFVAGSDIGMMADLTPEQSHALNPIFHEIFRKIEKTEKPVIAAINGYALGGGLELSLLCDIRIASENAKFGLPEVSLGIIPGSGGTQRLTRLIGKSRAKYMIYSGMTINAQKALEYGIVEQVLPREELLPFCLGLAKRFAEQPMLSLALAKRAIDLAAEVDLYSGITFETEAFTVAFASEEKKKRMAAFLEKKKF